MNDPAESEQLNELAHEFAELYRRGERPTVSEYADSYPDLADQIRELFPTLLVLEQLGSAVAPTSRKVGGYRILREIARGGMGVVYEAVEESLSRRVALKVMAHAPQDRSELNEFSREAKVAARLHHTHIVPVFAVGQSDSQHYYAMQFIEGRSLHVVLEYLKRERGRAGDLAASATERTPPSTERFGDREEDPEDDLRHRLARRESEAEASCFEIPPQMGQGPGTAYYRFAAQSIAAVADALEHAHQQGIIHCDIKPSNLLVSASGEIWLTDFGLAQFKQPQSIASTPSGLGGTLRYMAPERFHGEVDERTDVYSLGLTLYELLTLQPAHQCSDREELVRRIQSQPLRSPRQIDQRIPRDLESIVRVATNKDPGARYASAAAMANDLRCYLRGLPTWARPVSPLGKLYRWGCRHPSLAGTAVLIVLLLLSVASVSSTSSVKLHRQLSQIRDAQRLSRERRFTTLLAQANALRLTGREGQRFQALEVLGEARTIAEELDLPGPSLTGLGNVAVAALSLPDVELFQTVAWPEGTVAIDVDPDGARYAWSDWHGNVTVQSCGDGAVLWNLPQPHVEAQLSLESGIQFSPTGRYLQQLCTVPGLRGRYLRVWDLETGSPRIVLEVPGAVYGIAFASDSERLVINRTVALRDAGTPATFEVVVYDLTSTASRPVVRDADERSRMAFHPQLPQLAISGARGVRVVDLRSGDEISRWDLDGVTCLAWRPDGRQLCATVDTDPQIYRWDSVRRRPLRPLAGHNSGGVVFAFDPSGEILASTDWSGLLKLWNARSGKLLLATAAGGFTRGLRFGKEGRLLSGITVPGESRILRIAAGSELQRYELAAPYDAGFPQAVFGPGSRLLAATAKDATVIIDTVRSEEVARIPGVRIPLCFASPEALLTHAPLPEGLTYWPLSRDSESPRNFRLGPHQPVQVDGRRFGGLDFWSASLDGRMIAMPDYDNGANLFVAEREGLPERTLLSYRRIALGPQRDVRTCSVSPDGRWVATGSHVHGTITIWNTSTGQRNRDLIASGGGATFSSDGRLLHTISAKGLQLWKAGSWEHLRDLQPGHLAFDQRGKVLAIELPNSRLQLQEIDSGQELAKLAVPEVTSLKPVCFSPDGWFLAAFGLDNGYLYVWDLRTLGRSLAKHGIDWEVSGDSTVRQTGDALPRVDSRGVDTPLNSARPDHGGN